METLLKQDQAANTTVIRLILISARKEVRRNRSPPVSEMESLRGDLPYFAPPPATCIRTHEFSEDASEQLIGSLRRYIGNIVKKHLPPPSLPSTYGTNLTMQ